MLKVTVVGSGNVAWHLIKAINTCAGTELVQVVARNAEKLDGCADIAEIITSTTRLKEANVYILAINDNAIEEVSSTLPFNNRLVVHTSGSTALEVLDKKNRRGVLYPLQTFSKARKIDFKAVPLCLEAEHQKDYETLKQLAQLLSGNVFNINSVQRKSLHLSAVFCSNFTNHMYTLGNSICNENNVPFDILKPLITETANKIQELSPLQAQTGPAVRHDDKTINSHLEYLKHDNMKAIYQLLTQSIQQTNG